MIRDLVRFGPETTNRCNTIDWKLLVPDRRLLNQPSENQACKLFSRLCRQFIRQYRQF